MSTQRNGFTLVELALSLTITIVMVVSLHTIFVSVSGSVSLGVATSDIIQANKVLTNQIGDDADAMVGPLNAGFLVILQYRVEGVQLRPNETRVGDLRSDQIGWIRSVVSSGSGGVSTATPGGADSYEDAVTTTSFARVWYGHVLRTDLNGVGTGDVLGNAAGPNAIGSHWILGRQQLYLDPDPPSGTVYIDTQPDWEPGDLDPPPQPYPSQNWLIEAYESAGEIPTPSWHSGMSDILNRDLVTILLDFTTGDVDSGMSALGFPIGPYQFMFGTDRLWCNPEPATNAIDPWQLAQMHPHFIRNVSDLRIEYAGDFDDTVGIDTNPASGGVKWYSHFFNNPVEGRWDDPDPLAYDASEPETYRPVNPTMGDPLYEVAGDIDAVTQTDIESVLRSIYHIDPYDLNGPLPNADAAITFRPLAIDWPHMMRIRYRIHDHKTLLADRDGSNGKQFERVIKIPRGTLGLPVLPGLPLP